LLVSLDRIAEVSPDRGYDGKAGADDRARGRAACSESGPCTGDAKFFGAIESKAGVELGVHPDVLSMASNVISG
jgi:hypothetical protein